MPRARRECLSLGEATALGAVQGPTELLPVSSSAHTTLLPWLAGSPYAELPGRARKEFEVALHAGAGLALALAMRRELLAEAMRLDRRGAATIVLSTLPPALAGYALEGPIERRLGGPGAMAGGLAAGAVAMGLADLRPGALRHRPPPDGRGSLFARVRARARAPQKRKHPRSNHPRRGRRHHDARPCDGLALGIAQALALAPGISRSGATLTAARARGFARPEAAALSWHAALPVLLGASALKGWRLRQRVRLRGLGGEAGAEASASVGRGALLAGGLSAFGSTLLSVRAARWMRTSERSLAPFAAYRCLLAGVVVWRLLRRRGGA
ncbi:MAG TPA: undecaprenyl-diphosphate phosphatase [Solirubrobacteraceae bacterium]|nr:undecaprenyl-diphosphate phosphatase [Solirubrobacteraceae bacterium]